MDTDFLLAIIIFSIIGIGTITVAYCVFRYACINNTIESEELISIVEDN